MSYDLGLKELWQKDIPAQFQTQPNINAIITVLGGKIDELAQVFADINDLTNVDTAVGQNLDYVGDIVSLTRKDTFALLRGVSNRSIDDTTYRAAIRYKIIKNNTSCTYDDVMKCLYLLWGENVQITYREDPEEPATIHIDIVDISLDDTDPANTRPMAIRAGGIKFIFTSSFLQNFDLSSSEKFGKDTGEGEGAYVSYRKRHYFNREYKFDGSIPFASVDVTEAF